MRRGFNWEGPPAKEWGATGWPGCHCQLTQSCSCSAGRLSLLDSLISSLKENLLPATMGGSVKVILYLTFFFVPLADPGIAPLARTSTSDSETTTEFILDTDYRDYNITVDQPMDVGLIEEPEKRDEVHVHMIEQLCVEITSKDGTDIILLLTTIDIVITGTIPEPPTVFIAGNHGNNSNGCIQIRTTDAAGEDERESMGTYCFDFALVMLLLSLSFLVVLKIVKELTELKEARTRMVMTSELRRGGYIVVPPRNRRSIRVPDPWN